MTKREKTEITWKCDACGAVVNYRPSWVSVNTRGGNADVDIKVSSGGPPLVVRLLANGDYCSRRCLRSAMTGAMESLLFGDYLRSVPEVPV